MQTRFLAVLVTLPLAVPLSSSAADLRVGLTRYDGGAAVYGVGQSQHLICDNCPAGPALVLAPPRPVIRYETREMQPITVIAAQRNAPLEQVEEPVTPTPTPNSFSVYFGFNKSELSAEERQRIREVLAGGLAPSVLVRVDGYTCKVGSEWYNKKLSERRAKAVARYLRILGVQVATAEGLGKKHQKGAVIPKDRRAEILIKERN